MQRPRPHLHQTLVFSRLSREMSFNDDQSGLETIPMNEPPFFRPSSIASRNYGQDSSLQTTRLPSHGEDDVSIPLLVSVRHGAQSGQTIASTLSVDTAKTASPTHVTNAQRLSPTISLADNSLAQAYSESVPSRRPDSAMATAHGSPTPGSPRTPGGTDARFPRAHRKHPFSKRSEPPQWRALALHVAACALSAPLLLLFVHAARGRTLFWARALVGAGCTVLGCVLGTSLVRMAGRIMEAAGPSYFGFLYMGSV